jgi:hypothetical protein
MEKKKIFETLGTVAVTIVAIAVGTLVASVTLTLMYNMIAALFD